jgi:4-amino-4-deoxy-L-arabinose transferase-like glycosyltransferase
LLSGLVALLSLFLSKPVKKRWAIAAALLIVAQTLWQAVDTYNTSKARQEVERYIYYQLAWQTSEFLDRLSTLIVYSSATRIPTTEEEFFSPRMAAQVCSELNIRYRAPVANQQQNPGAMD